MSFPVSPVNNQTAVVNGITYTYNSTNGTWTRQPQPYATAAATNGILINSNRVSQNIVISANTNGLAVGPLTLANGITLTVTSGQRLIIL